MKAFVIGLEDKQSSYQGATQGVNQLRQFGINAEFYPGTPGDQAVTMAAKGRKTLYPYGIKSKKLTAEDLKKYVRPELYNEFIESHYWTIMERSKVDLADIGKLSRPGVIGCFYSHYNLWEKCVELNESIMIFEDDVKFYRGYMPVDFEGVLILSLGKTAFLNEPFKTYLESPQGSAQALPWKNASMPGTSGYAIMPSAAAGLVKKYRPYWCPSDNAINQFVCKIQIHNHLMGRHILSEEGNISMTKHKDW